MSVAENIKTRVQRVNPSLPTKKINLYISTGYVVRIARMALHSRRTR